MQFKSRFYFILLLMIIGGVALFAESDNSRFPQKGVSAIWAKALLEDASKLPDEEDEGFSWNKILGRKTYPDAKVVDLHHYNYFLFFQEPAKFQISVKFRLYLPESNKDETGFYIAYTQKSLWDLYNGEKSRPFIESNYMPEFFYKYDFGKGFPAIKSIQYGMLHESNGLGDNRSDDSRSWNYMYAEATFKIGRNILFITPRFWLPFSLSDNADILDYYGYGSLTIETGISPYFFESRLQIILRKGWSKDFSKGSIEVNNVLGPFEFGGKFIIPFAIFIQLWHGYGETLLQYNKSQTKLRVGVSFVLN